MSMNDTYDIGPAQGLSRALYSPDGQPWCRFGSGSTACLNESEQRQCQNPWHRDDRGIPEAAWWFIGFMSTMGAEW